MKLLRRHSFLPCAHAEWFPPNSVDSAFTMASKYVWTTRSIPAFSICLVAVLLVLSFCISPYGIGEAGKHNGKATTAQIILSVYTVFLHILSIVFPARVCLSMAHILKKMRETLQDLPSGRRRRVQSIVNEEKEVQSPVPLFAIILPAYKEEIATLEETLRVLASHTQARQSYHVRICCNLKDGRVFQELAQRPSSSC